mmetsp:Transcript_42895/g.98411  ORF Transcript_42895/g.98411 Transcript_42895/m.98411 type:complete len:185 (+) Transcript_42895:75-629(+)
MTTPSTPCRKRRLPRFEETPQKAEGHRRALLPERLEANAPRASDAEKPEPLAIVSDGEQIEFSFGGTRYRVLDKASFKELLSTVSSQQRMSVEDFRRMQRASTTCADSNSAPSSQQSDAKQHRPKEACEETERASLQQPGSSQQKGKESTAAAEKLSESAQERARRILRLLAEPAAEADANDPY